jgi:hypothetical protein
LSFGILDSGLADGFARLFLAAFLVDSTYRHASLILAWLRFLCSALWAGSVKKQVFHVFSLRRIAFSNLSPTDTMDNFPCRSRLKIGRRIPRRGNGFRAEQ